MSMLNIFNDALLTIAFAPFHIETQYLETYHIYTKLIKFHTNGVPSSGIFSVYHQGDLKD